MIFFTATINIAKFFVRLQTEQTLVEFAGPYITYINNYDHANISFTYA